MQQFSMVRNLCRVYEILEVGGLMAIEAFNGGLTLKVVVYQLGFLYI